MKKMFMALSLALIVVVFAGCENMANNPSNETDERFDAQNGNGAQNSIIGDITTPDEVPGSATPADSYIGEDRAREIALNKAGLSEKDVVFTKTKLDFDDGVWQYEVEFRKDNTEYDVDIKADDGTILHYDVDVD